MCERRCLEQCGICRDRQFAVVDGRPVSGTELSAVLADLVGSEETDERPADFYR
ncbi:DUF1450 domain-containing protein [Halomicroarcula sp. GCM10025710]